MYKDLKGLMGLCVRAGQSIFGEEGCLKAMRNGQTAAILMDGGISEAAAERYVSLGKRENIPVFRIPAGFLAEATGRPGKVMAVRPGGFADRIIRILEKKPDGEKTTNDFNADKRQGG